jgi:hypothetical protein
MTEDQDDDGSSRLDGPSSVAEDHSCPLCNGLYPDDLVAKIRSAKPGEPMTPEAFKAWLDQSSSPPADE